MARIRTIKPEFWRSPDIAELTFFERLLFIGLWNLADDEGRGVYSPAAIAADLFLTEFSLNPHGVITDIERGFMKYSKQGMVAVYEAENREFYQVLRWSEHQRVNRPSKSKIPPLTSGNEKTFSLTEDSLNAHGGLTPGTGNREQGTGNREQGNYIVRTRQAGSDDTHTTHLPRCIRKMVAHLPQTKKRVEKRRTHPMATSHQDH